MTLASLTPSRVPSRPSHAGGLLLWLICFRGRHQPLAFKAEVILRQQLKQLENRYRSCEYSGIQWSTMN